MAQATARGGARRPREQQEPRQPFTVKLSAAERAKMADAADRAGDGAGRLAVRDGDGRGRAPGAPVPEMHREMLAELIRVRGLVRRAGVNLNQAVARLNATGEPGPDLEPAAAYCMRVLATSTRPPSRSAGGCHDRPGPGAGQQARQAAVVPVRAGQGVRARQSAPGLGLVPSGRGGAAAAPGRAPGFPPADRAAAAAGGRWPGPGPRPTRCGTASVRAAPEDPDLGDGAWMRIAAEVMDRTGLSRRGEEDEGVRWVAVRHFPIK